MIIIWGVEKEVLQQCTRGGEEDIGDGGDRDNWVNAIDTSEEEGSHLVFLATVVMSAAERLKWRHRGAWEERE